MLAKVVFSGVFQQRPRYEEFEHLQFSGTVIPLVKVMNDD